MTAISAQPGLRNLEAWSYADESDRRFRRIVTRTVLPVAALAVLIPLIHFQLDQAEDKITPVGELIVLPEPERIEVQPPPPEPEVKQEEAKAKEPQKAQAETPKVERQPAEQPKPAAQQAQAAPSRAREIAQQSGLMRFNEQMSALRSSDDALQAMNQPLLTSDASTAPAASSSQLAANMAGAAAARSGGAGSTGKGLAGNDSGTRLGSRRTEGVQSGIGFGRGNGTGAGATGSGSGAAQTRTTQEIQLVFDRNKTAFFAMFNRAARQNPGMGAGTIVMRLTIQADGSVSDCALVSSTFGDSELEEKILQRVRLMNFGPKNVGVFVYPNYPLAYLPP